jgi:alkanesulfonate monooxygenase SsuD/methylene tetrahydromethanopterin reductase-like flavin-dependent oxidoreductase (luciferase family)
MTGCAIGRDEAELAARLERWRTVVGGGAPPQVAGTVDRVAETLLEYGAAGVERVMLQHLVHEDVDMVGVLGDLALRVAS